SHPALRGLLADISAADMLRPEEVAALTLPTLLIWGREERVLPRAHLAFFADHLPAQAEIEEWPDLGHVGFVEQPGGLVRRSLTFARALAHNVCATWPSTLSGERDTLR